MTVITGITKNPMKKFWGVLGIIQGIGAVVQYYQSKNLDKRADALQELIENQPKEEAAA
jgi:hypothetical protein